MCVVSNMGKDLFPGGPVDPWTLPKNPWYPPYVPMPTYPKAIPYETEAEKKAREEDERKKLEDFYKRKHPNMIPWDQVTPDLAQQLLKIISMLEALDKRMGNMECKLEEAEKKAILDKLEGIAKKDMK